MGDSSLGIVVLRTNLLVLRSKHMGADGYEPKGDELSSRQKKRVAGLSQTPCHSYLVCKRMCSKAEQFLGAWSHQLQAFACELWQKKPSNTSIHSVSKNVNGRQLAMQLCGTWCFPLRSALSAISYFDQLTGAKVSSSDLLFHPLVDEVNKPEMF